MRNTPQWAMAALAAFVLAFGAVPNATAAPPVDDGIAQYAAVMPANTVALLGIADYAAQTPTANQPTVEPGAWVDIGITTPTAQEVRTTTACDVADGCERVSARHGKAQFAVQSYDAANTTAWRWRDLHRRVERSAHHDAGAGTLNAAA